MPIRSILAQSKPRSTDWSQFWDRAKAHELWGPDHPVNRRFTASQRSQAVPVAMHGDEGQGKKSRSLMVLSWSIVNDRRKHILLYKFPICCIRSINFAYNETGENLTLLALQEAIVKDLQYASQPERTPLAKNKPLTLQLCIAKGDWKFQSAWLSEVRTYANHPSLPADRPVFCRRCLCSTNIDSNHHWLDMKERGWFRPGEVSGVLDANIGSNIPCLVQVMFFYPKNPFV